MQRHPQPTDELIGDRPEPAVLVFTVKEAAERLKVSPGTVRNMIEEGQLHAVRLHVRRIVIPAWALDELLARPTLRALSTPRRPS